MAAATPEEIQERFDRLGEILGGIVGHADAQASSRCPYRDRHDLCTAKFRCRNQIPLLATADDDGLSCGHDGAFDYRSAWESDPRTADDARRKIGSIRSRAAQRRDDSGD
jgi:hypothetical protein